MKWDDRWILPLRGNRVVAVDFGTDVTFALDSGVRIIVGPGAFFTRGSIRAPDADVRTLARWERDVILRSVGAQVLAAVGFNTGALRVVLSTGWHLDVSSTPEPFVPAAVTDGDTVFWTRTAPA